MFILVLDDQDDFQPARKQLQNNTKSRTENCLQGLVFVITGELNSLTREQSRDMILRHGGRITLNLSSKTSFLVAGQHPGPAKMSKAKQLGTRILDEDGLLSLIQKLPSRSEPVFKRGVFPTPKTRVQPDTDSIKKTWTERYKPQKIPDIVGNKEEVRRISEWLRHWTADQSAILISGPPGIGKTTTAYLIAQRHNFWPLELNASHERSRYRLQQYLNYGTQQKSITEFFYAQKSVAKRNLWIIDEVDGMTGSDQGGLQELVSLIKKSKVPIICICNDTKQNKMDLLLKVCLQFKFKRTPAAQIRPKLSDMLFKEKLRIQPNPFNELVLSTGNDIRQILNILSLHSLKGDTLSFDEAKRVAQDNIKSHNLNIFEIPNALMSIGQWRQRSLEEKSDLYFHDYSMAPLMIYENYCIYQPVNIDHTQETLNTMECTAQAIEAIASGDLVDRKIHSLDPSWSLMPFQSILSCVLPSYYMKGYSHQQPRFPTWFAYQSKTNKTIYDLNQLQSKMRKTSSGNTWEIRQNYLATLNERILDHIKKGQYRHAIQYMDRHYLDEKNLIFINDLLGSPEKFSHQSYSAFLQSYNLLIHPVLFQTGDEPVKKKKKTF